MSNHGFVYILGNEYMPDLIKIGCSERSPHARAEELSKPTGVPVPFEVLCHIEVDDFQAVERNMHKWCEQYRVNSGREFFHGCLRWAVQLLFFHPRRLSFTDCTAGTQSILSSMLATRVTQGDENYFDDLEDPFESAEKKAERQRVIDEFERSEAAAAEVVAANDAESEEAA